MRERIQLQAKFLEQLACLIKDNDHKVSELAPLGTEKDAKCRTKSQSILIQTPYISIHTCAYKEINFQLLTQMKQQKIGEQR